MILSTLGILTSAQQVSILGILGALPLTSEHAGARDVVRRYLLVLLSERKPGTTSEGKQDQTASSIGVWEPKWKMVFTWQCAMMFMSYSVCLFILGLTMLVCTPLIKDEHWTDASTVSLHPATPALAVLTTRQTAVVYLLVAGAGVAAFAFCSFWVLSPCVV